MTKRVSNSQIPRTGPRMIRGKGRKFGSDTPVRTHGVVFRELWVSSPIVIISCTIGLVFTRIGRYSGSAGVPILSTVSRYRVSNLFKTLSSFRVLFRK